VKSLLVVEILKMGLKGREIQDLEGKKRKMNYLIKL